MIFAPSNARTARKAGRSGARQAVKATDGRNLEYTVLVNASSPRLPPQIGFIIGNALFSAMLLRLNDAFSRVIGIFFALALVTSLIFFSGELGGPVLPEGIGFWVYPAIQPIGRTLIGLWLLRVARNGEPRVNAAG